MVTITQRFPKVATTAMIFEIIAVKSDNSAGAGICVKQTLDIFVRHFQTMATYIIILVTFADKHRFLFESIVKRKLYLHLPNITTKLFINFLSSFTITFSKVN